MSRRIAVLGGGISGLAAAWNLASKQTSPRCLEVVLYEASKRVGGWMKTQTTSEGAVFETGPRSLRIVGKSADTTMELISNVGLESELLPVKTSNLATQKRFIYTEKNGLVEIPSGPSWAVLIKPPFTKPLLGTLVKEVFAKPGSGDESVYDFFQRRLSKEVADYVIDPLCRGVFASSPKSLSLQSCFPYFHEYERKYGSLIKGTLLDKPETSSNPSPLLERAKADQWAAYSFKNGLQTLPDTLVSKLVEKGVKVNLEQSCSNLVFEEGKAKLEVGGEVEAFDHIVSAIPANRLASLLTQEVHSPLSDSLISISNVHVGIVMLEYKGRDIVPQEYRKAFGYLVPSCEPSRILGVVFDSATFPDHDRKDTPSTRLTVMMGGEWFQQLFGDPRTCQKDTLSQTALEELHKHMGVTAQPSLISTSILIDAIPQYSVGHSLKIESISNHISSHRLPLSVCGSSYSGVSVNDCIHNSVLASNELV